MILIARVPRATMDANHAAAARKSTRAAPVARPPQFNAAAVLDLGNLIYFTFRGRAYGVPPLGWRRGQQLLDLWIEASEFEGRKLTRADTPRYFAIIQTLAQLTWASVFPASVGLRWLRRLGLLRNPFQAGTEADIVSLAGFLLSLRTRSGIGTVPMGPSPGPVTDSTT